MRYRNMAKMGTLAVLGFLLFSVPVFASPPVASAVAPASTEVNWYSADRASTLLESLHSLNVTLARDGQTLNTFAQSNQVSWQSHAQYLNKMREHVNYSGRLLGELQGLRDSAHPWQRKAIDRIVPIAAELADHTQAALEHLRDNQSQLFVAEYTEHLEGIGDRSLEFKDAVSDFVDYGKTQERLEGLERKLEISGS